MLCNNSRGDHGGGDHGGGDHGGDHGGDLCGDCGGAELEKITKQIMAEEQSEEVK